MTWKMALVTWKMALVTWKMALVTWKMALVAWKMALLRIFGDVRHPLPGGGLYKQFPNAPKLDTTHPCLLTT